MSAGDDVHYFDGAGIEEGNGSVPRWFIGFMAMLFIVLVAYLGVYLVGAQPNTAQIVGDDAPAAAQPDDEQPAAPEGE